MPEVENPSSKIFALPLAIGLGAALLSGYALVTCSAIYEKAHRTSIEHADASYAVGDQALFPQTFDAALPLVNFEGHSLYFVARKDAMDSAMVRAGMDDGNAYSVYKLTTSKGDEGSFFYLKIAPNSYVKAKRQ